MSGSTPDFDNVTIFGDDEDPEFDDGRTIAMSLDDNQTVLDDNEDNETVLEAPTVVANSGPCHHQARKKKAEEEALLFERFKLLVQKGQSSLEQERPQPAAEHASSSSAAAFSHQPRDLLQPCAKRKERKRNRREMDEDTGVWKEYFTSHRHYEKEVLGKKKGRGGKNKLHKRR